MDMVDGVLLWTGFTAFLIEFHLILAYFMSKCPIGIQLGIFQFRAIGKRNIGHAVIYQRVEWPIKPNAKLRVLHCLGSRPGSESEFNYHRS